MLGIETQKGWMVQNNIFITMGIVLEQKNIVQTQRVEFWMEGKGGKGQ